MWEASLRPRRDQSVPPPRGSNDLTQRDENAQRSIQLRDADPSGLGEATYTGLPTSHDANGRSLRRAFLSGGRRAVGAGCVLPTQTPWSVVWGVVPRRRSSDSGGSTHGGGTVWSRRGLAEATYNGSLASRVRAGLADNESGSDDFRTPLKTPGDPDQKLRV